jgi:GT2 family glycosyltransferase
VVSVSVVICAFNPNPGYLRRVLQALEAQSLEKDDWELLLVDNASETPLNQTWDLSWHPRGRHVSEPGVGLTAARLRGIQEARGDVLVFVDDDNVVDTDYLRTARELFGEHAHLGAIGAGCLAPAFETEPAAELRPYLGSLALRSVSRASWSNNTNDPHCVPWGAGLCVRRQVAVAYGPLLQELGVKEFVDRHGDRLYGNGDVAFSWSAVSCGWGFGVFPQLRITHLIRQERLKPQYLLRLARDTSFSNSLLDYLWAGTPPPGDTSSIGLGIRLLLRAVRRGSFAARHAWATARGVAQARQLIHARNLQPVRLHALARGAGNADAVGDRAIRGNLSVSPLNRSADGQ